MGTRTKLLAALALAGACGALAVPSVAGAARTGVTIHQHRDSLYGYVFSPKPDQCAKGRKVRLLKQKGKHKHPSRDRRIASTSAHEVTSGPHKGKFKWEIEIQSSFGNGRVYAFTPKARKRDHRSECDRDTSETIEVSRRPNTKITRVSIQHRDNRAIFEYHAVGGIKPYDLFCRLGKHPVEECGNTRETYGDVSPGRHVFRVWAVGGNGLKERTPAKRTFKM
jgi:hypothetical protein